MSQIPQTPGTDAVLPAKRPVTRGNTWKNRVKLAILATVLAALAACVFVEVYGVERIRLQWDIWRYSRVAHDGKIFARLLHLKNGDSIQHVYGIFWTVTVNKGIVGYLDLDAAKNPARYPEGVRPDDTVLECCCVQAGYVYLQVRDGKLINYSPDNYRHLLDYK